MADTPEVRIDSGGPFVPEEPAPAPTYAPETVEQPNAPPPGHGDETPLNIPEEPEPEFDSQSVDPHSVETHD